MSIYRGEFTSFDGTDYTIDLTTTYSATKPGAGSVTASYVVEDGSANLSYESEDNALIGLFPSAFEWTFVAEDNTDYTTLTGLFDRYDETWFVIVYKSGDTALYWEGFLNMLPTSYDYSSENQSFNFKAFDYITLLKDRKVWEQWPGLYGVEADRRSGAFPGGSLYSIATGFGYYRSDSAGANDDQIPDAAFTYNGNAYDKAWRFYPFLPKPSWGVGLVYSLLYDLTIEKTTIKSLTSAFWDDSSGVRNSSVGTLHSLWKTDLVPYILYDSNNIYISGLTPRMGVREDLDIYKFLSEYTKYLRARLFQHEGNYYFMQVECYKGNASNEIETAVFDNDWSGGRPGAERTVVASSSSRPTLTATDYELDVTAPRTEGLMDVNIDIIEPYREVVLKMFNTYGGKDQTFKATVDAGGSNNFTPQRANKYELEIKSFGFEDMYYTNDTIRSWVDGANETNTYPNLFVKRMASFYSGPRDKINAGLINADYSFLKSLVFNSKDYLPARVKYDLNQDKWNGEWIEFTVDTTNVGTPTG